MPTTNTAVETIEAPRFPFPEEIPHLGLGRPFNHFRLALTGPAQRRLEFAVTPDGTPTLVYVRVAESDGDQVSYWHSSMDGERLAETLAAAGGHAYTTFASQLRLLTCDLNPLLYERSQIPVDRIAWQLDALADHIAALDTGERPVVVQLVRDVVCFLNSSEEAAMETRAVLYALAVCTLDALEALPTHATPTAAAIARVIRRAARLVRAGNIDVQAISGALTLPDGPPNDAQAREVRRLHIQHIRLAAQYDNALADDDWVTLFEATVQSDLEAIEHYMEAHRARIDEVVTADRRLAEMAEFVPLMPDDDIPF